MDQLFKRYADPFSILDGYIGTGRFCEFIGVFVKQKTDDDKWEVWLHKVFDKSYEAYLSDVDNQIKLQNMNPEELKATVEESMNILKNFTPDMGEGEK